MLSLDLQTIYLCGLILAGSAAVLYALFGDAFDALDSAPHIALSPIVILSFLSVLSGSGYIFTNVTDLSSSVIFVISLLLSFILVTVMAVFVFTPLSKAEQSTSISMNDFVGAFGEVSVTIPGQGYGEVLIIKKSGVQNMTAKSANEEVIASGSRVFVHGVEDGVLIVKAVPVHLLMKMNS